MRALILEGGDELGSLLAEGLAGGGVAADLCAWGEDVVSRASRDEYDLLVVVSSGSDANGLSVCRELRRTGAALPILIVTERGETRDRVMGLEAGADDYMVKPFAMEEFIARVRALLRRSARSGVVLRYGPLEVDLMTQEAKVAGAPLSLTQREYAVLLRLVHRRGDVVRRSDLLAHIWGLQSDPGTNVVDVHISRLREKLGDQAWIIETVRGTGYRIRTE